MNISSYRKDFPMLEKKIDGYPFIYLDSAATTLKPKCVIDTITEYYSSSYGTVHRAVYRTAQLATERYQLVRQKVQHFIGAESPNEIVFTRGTTEAINLVATCLGKVAISAGDEVIITEIEHHSNLIPWQFLCKEKGAKLIIAPVNDYGELNLDAFKKLLSHKTKLVAISHISNVLGTVHPIKEIAKITHQAGAYLLVDGAQAIAHIPVDVQELGVDFYTFSGHKCYGPTGIGVLYGKNEVLDLMPPYHGGGDMVEIASLDENRYHPSPLKFEAGTPMIAQVLGLGAAIDYMELIGRERIAHCENELSAYVQQGFKKIPQAHMVGQAKEKGPIFSFIIDGVHHLDIGTLLDLKAIAIRTGNQCSQITMNRFGIPGVSRLSLAFYNTIEELDLFFHELKKVINKLTR